MTSAPPCAVYSKLREADARADLGDGWTTAVSVRTDFGGDFLTRARVALNWIGTLGIEEAMYIKAEVDAAGDVLDGLHRYVLRLYQPRSAHIDATYRYPPVVRVD